jgi:hypothetical protein
MRRVSELPVRPILEKKGGTNGVLIRAGRPVTQLVLSSRSLRKTFAERDFPTAGL